MLLKLNSNILFVGINPSLEPSDGFFGTSRNQFFKLFQSAGLSVHNDKEMQEKCNVSFMNYVDRPTKSEKDITNDELAAGKVRLNEIIEMYKPRLVCFVGKKCCKYHMYIPKSNNNIEYGGQERKINNVPVFCIPHGSTKGATLSFEAKLNFYKQLQLNKDQ